MEISPKQTLTVKVGHYSFPLGIEMIIVCPSRKGNGSAGLRAELLVPVQ
jgi:hypothetical protein